jgi:Carbohydrate esterase, sialic acid-specific acetylesterase
MKTLRLFVIVLLGVFTSAQAAAPALPAKEKFHLFLLVGQSNMAGRGPMTDADQIPHERVLMLNQAGAWVPAADPLHFVDLLPALKGRVFAPSTEINFFNELRVRFARMKTSDLGQ